MDYCIECGSKLKEGHKYCRECGSKIPNELPEILKHCPECGNAIREGHRFCDHCGFKTPEKKETITEDLQENKEITPVLEFSTKGAEGEDSVPIKEASFIHKYRFLLFTFFLIFLFITIVILLSRGGPAPFSTVTPSADFSFTTSGSSVTFYDTSTSPNGIVLYSWNFGDGTTSTERNPTHRYTNSGNYHVSYTITDGNGKTYSKHQYVSVTVPNKPPQAMFYKSVNGLTVTFTDTSADSDGNIKSWFWNFGDGATSNSRNPTHTYQRGGTYTVTLTIYDDDGSHDDASTTIQVTNPPDIRVTDYSTYDTLDGANKVGYVDVTVMNYGGDGSDTISVTVCQGNNQWTKTKTLYLNAGKSTLFSLRFPEINFWTLDSWYVCSYS